MVKGRKPTPKNVKTKALAPKKEAAASIVEVEPTALEKAPLDANTGKELATPLSVQILPAAEECWHVIMDNQTRFTAHEVPLIESYCLAYAAMRQAAANMTAAGDGTMEILVKISGQAPKKNPNWSVFSEAVDKMRHLSGVLGLDTLTAERLNLTKAATASLAVDLPARIRKAAREALDER